MQFLRAGTLIFYWTLVFNAIACTNILSNAYGIKTPKKLSNEHIMARSAKLNIAEAEVFVLDRKYFAALEKKDSSRPLLKNKCSPMISKYQQPLQLMYFDEAGRLISFHNNCYASGFPVLKWNTQGQFDKYIPTTTIPITDSVLKMDLVLTHIYSLKGNKYESSGSKSTVIVFWSDFMLKQSKELVKVAKDNLRLDPTKSARVFFVNVDNCFVDEKYSSQINKTD